MNTIRVLFANYPLMIPNTIRQLVAEQEDMEVVGECRGPMHILQETGRSKADAVIFSHDDTQEPGLCSQLLSVYPDLTIFSVTPDLASVFTQQLRASRRDFVSVQGQDVMQLLRVAVGDSGDSYGERYH